MVELLASNLANASPCLATDCLGKISTLHVAQGVGISQCISVRLGMNVEEIGMSIHGGMDGLIACIRAPDGYMQEWIEIPRDKWSVIKPKKDGVLMFGYRLHGGSAKNIFRIVATVIVAALLPGIGAYLASTALGVVGGAVVTAAIGIGANLAINALFPATSPSFGGGAIGGGVGVGAGGGFVVSGGGATGGAISVVANNPSERARQFSNVESGSNVLAKESYLPYVAGSRRIVPPEIASPRFYLDKGVQTIDRIFALDGHHEISDVEVDRAPVADFSSIEVEIKDGAEATGVSTFVDKITKFGSIGETLSTFSLNALNLVDQEDPSNSEPRWLRFVTVRNPRMEEISVRIQVDNFFKSDSATEEIRVPVRIRFRPKGASGGWFNLPEIHLIGRDVSTSLKEIRFRWDGNFGGSDTSGDIRYEFFQRVPQATYQIFEVASGNQWKAHEHFVAGSGLTSSANISGKRNGLRVVLDEDVFPKQEYEWEIKRGIAIKAGDLVVSSYTLSGMVNSFFCARNTNAKWQVPIDQGSFVGRLTVSHVTSVIDSQPCQRPKTALIAVKSRGQSVKSLTAVAARYVLDWDGEGWNNLITTSNPAIHYRHVLADYLNYNGIDVSLISNVDLLGWRQECIDQGYEVSATFAGSSVRDVLASIATAGFARPRYSDGFGVDWFRDRSSERPMLMFSPRNATISIQFISGEKPIGIRAKFQNEALDYRDDELQVNNPFYTNFSGYDVLTYDTISNASLLERRLYFDILQAYFQGRKAWVIDTAIEGLVCDRGDLIGVVSDLLDDANSGARIRRVIDSTNFTIDQEIPAESTQSIFDTANIFDPENIFNVGESSVCMVTTPTGTEMATIVAAEKTPDGNVIRIDAPFSSTDLAGAHIVLGPASNFTNRCIVSEVRRLNEERAQIICVDEAPEIFRKMQERFS